MKKCGWLILFIVFLNQSAVLAKLPDDTFAQLRAQATAEGQKSPSAGITKIDELLSRHQDTLAKAQTIRLLYMKSWYQINSDLIEQAMDTLAQTRLLARDIDEPGILYSYYSISASALSNAELYELALENNLKAYQEAPLLKRPEFISQTENNIGHVYLKLGLLDEAENYFQRFYDFAAQQSLIPQQGTGLNNLGEVALEKGQIDKAHSLHEQALALRQAHGLAYHEAWSLFNLGRVYAAKQEFVHAEQFLKQAIKSWESKNATSKTLQAKFELAKIYVQQQRSHDAEAQLQSIIDLGQAHKQLTLTLAALKLYGAQLKQDGALEKALSTQEQYNEIADKFAKKQASIGLAYMLSQTELQTKEMALKQLEQAHQVTLAMAEADRQLGWFILTSATLIIIITWYFMYRLNNKKRQLQALLSRLERTQEKLVESEKMRAMTTLVSGMAHQLNTPLGLVITADSTLQSLVEKLATGFASKTLTQNQLAQFIRESTELLTLSQKNSEKAADMVQRFKMMSAKLHMSECSTFALLSFLKENIGRLAQSQNKAIHFNLSGDDIEVTNYAPVLLKVITQLIENSVKHGFVDTQEPQVDITIQCDKKDAIIHYKDNGAGIPLDKRKQVFDPFYTTRLGEGNLGLGLNIIYNCVVHIMNGQVECVEDAQGAHFVIRFPRKITNSSGNE
ncbi:tetratricopeptide repeat protein [Pseudoalteromonas sp. MMG022]|uniref:tetratricopeptide repeat protein n=1 Tax=Pseudoalteromonas sp. MMG022 TaxID=2909978 RepID=UPI001F1B4D41|nr:tetratricopeptide repeat protein [Pseudoalteromonas sp. MMG022]MCF6437112.1 tetratricopeptide repeat-containing sensor histidine kinase [Pseudoalteromonas sp. MMG022]